MIRTIFLIRATHDQTVVDSRLSYVCDGVAEAIKAEQVAGRLLGTGPDIMSVMDRFPEATKAVNAYSEMSLRRRYNNDIFGPFVLTSDDELCDEFLVDWWKENKRV